LPNFFRSEETPTTAKAPSDKNDSMICCIVVPPEIKGEWCPVLQSAVSFKLVGDGGDRTGDVVIGDVKPQYGKDRVFHKLLHEE
jgi:hypothetical protein